MSRRGLPGRRVTVARAQTLLERAEQSLARFRRLRRAGPWRDDPAMRSVACNMVRWNVRRVRFWRARLAGALRREREVT